MQTQELAVSLMVFNTSWCSNTGVMVHHLLLGKSKPYSYLLKNCSAISEQCYLMVTFTVMIFYYTLQKHCRQTYLSPNSVYLTWCCSTQNKMAMSLTKMLQVNKSLTHLGLSNCLHIHTVSHWIIFEGLEHNTTLRYLNIRGISDITETDAEHIAWALKSNYSLQILDIADCTFLGRNGIDLILESLMFNSTLQTLYVSDIDPETLSTFKRARESKKLPLIKVYVSYWSQHNFIVPSFNDLLFHWIDPNSLRFSFCDLFDPTVIKYIYYRITN